MGHIRLQLDVVSSIIGQKSPLAMIKRKYLRHSVYLVQSVQYYRMSHPRGGISAGW